MSGDPSKFLPGGSPTTPATPTSYVVPLADVRYVLKAQYFNPLRGADAPLPDHRFFLLRTGNHQTRNRVHGEPSEPDGVSWIPYQLEDSFLDDPGSRWALSFLPFFRQPDGSLRPRADVIQNGEVFVDLDRNEWVGPDDVAVIERRRLLRLPVWVSFMKARSGGFVDAPPGTAFASTGLLRQDRNELTYYGDKDKPWLVQIDHGLFRNHVRFHYYDLREKKRRPVPRGLLVEARNVQALNLGEEGRVAAGTALDDEGTVYLLHDRTPSASRDTHYAFSTMFGSDHAMLDLTAADPNERMRLEPASTNPRPGLEYDLPREWHSLGMQGWLREDQNGFGVRRPIGEIANADTTAAAPLKFHLDDAVLAAGDPAHLESVAKGMRVTIFDQLLAIRDPDPEKPHFWARPLSTNYLPAEDAVHVNGEGVERLTRLVYHEGAFYDLVDKRVVRTGPIGSSPCVGARAAVKEDLDDRHRVVSYVDGNPTQPVYGPTNANGPGRSIFHLIDASHLSFAYDTERGTIDTRLMHLLVFLPVVLDATAAGPRAAADLDRALTEAAHWLDLEHPAHPGSPAGIPAKSYALVPSGGVSAGSRVVKVRHFFAPAPAAHPAAFTITLTQPKPGQPNAGNTDAVNRKMQLFVGDFRAQAGGQPEAGQSLDTTRFVLPHELNHALGYADEYAESLADTGFRKWDQETIAGARARPFATDAPGIMTEGSALRLRHYWNYASRLREEPVFRAMLGADYVPERARSDAGPLRCELPFLPPEVMRDERKKGPLVPVHAGFFLDEKAPRCDATLYRLAEDEATAGSLLLPYTSPEAILAKDRRYDGLVILRVKIMIDFDKTFDAITRAVVFGQLGSLFYQSPAPPVGPGVVIPPPQPKTMWVVTPTGAGPQADPRRPPFLKRIAVVYHPEYDYASRYTDKNDLPPIGHVNLRMRAPGTSLTTRPMLEDFPSEPLEITPDDIGPWLVRYVHGLRTYVERDGVRVAADAIAPGEVPILTGRISAILKDPPGIGRAMSTP